MSLEQTPVPDTSATTPLRDLSLYIRLQASLDQAFDVLQARQEALFKADFLRSIPPEGPLFRVHVPVVSCIVIHCSISDPVEHNLAFHKLCFALKDVGASMEIGTFGFTAVITISNPQWIIRWEVVQGHNIKLIRP